ncbi:hypothetical protein CGZ80_26170 [Rhodopirellula sp. MGV]|nr:hypothetical protein CGZ80_26170 [Rhodopirellula sp. MGV]PNY38814.1 hypothetical protein C2E31_02625 [Rhodopirellula baltica]
MKSIAPCQSTKIAKSVPIVDQDRILCTFAVRVTVLPIKCTQNVLAAIVQVKHGIEPYRQGIRSVRRIN